MATPRPSRKLTQVQLISLILGFILLVTVIVLIAVYPCASDDQRWIYKIVLSFAVAGLASILPGFFEFKFKGIISAGGGLAVFAFVYLYEPAIVRSNNSCEFKLTLKFYNDTLRSEVVQYLPVDVTYGNRSESSESNSQGEITLLINESLRGSELLVNTKGDDFIKEQIKTTIPDEGSMIHVSLHKKAPETVVHGTMVDAEGNIFGDAEVLIEGYRGEVNSKGEFKLVVPLAPGTNVLFQVFKNGKLVHSRHEDIQSKHMMLTL